MAWIVADGFDYYLAIGDIARSVWDSYGGALGIAASPGRFGGQALFTSFTGVTDGLVKSFANDGTIYINLGHYHNGAVSGTNVPLYFQLRDGATAQCTLCFTKGTSQGKIELRAGTHTGTVVASYSPAYPQDIWNHFQCKVVISNTAGSLTIRKNGDPSDTFSATGLNTRGGTANNYANVITVGSAGVDNSTLFDDLLIFSGSGAAPNTWVGDSRAVCLPPVTDAGIQFGATPGGTLLCQYAGGIVPQTYNANEVNWCGNVVPTRGGAFTAMSVQFNGAYTGNIQAALYLSIGTNQPDARIAVSNVLTNPATGVQTFTFPAGTYLASGRQYHFAILPSANVSLLASNSPQLSRANAYASGFPDPAGSPTSTPANRSPWLAVTLAGNCLMVSETLMNSDTDYVSSATVGQQDLYEVSDLVGVTAQAVIGTVSKMCVKKSDAGARSGQLQVVSGATQVAGADTLLPTTYSWLSRVDTTDPNTGAAWTQAGVNAMKIGVKVTL